MYYYNAKKDKNYLSIFCWDIKKKLVYCKTGNYLTNKLSLRAIRKPGENKI